MLPLSNRAISKLPPIRFRRAAELTTKVLRCNLAAEKSEAELESGCREAKAKCNQLHPLVLFYLLNAFDTPLLLLNRTPTANRADCKRQCCQCDRIPCCPGVKLVRFAYSTRLGLLPFHSASLRTRSNCFLRLERSSSESFSRSIS